MGSAARYTRTLDGAPTVRSSAAFAFAIGALSLRMSRVGYRDEHEALQARATALEQRLHEVEIENERLRSGSVDPRKHMVDLPLTIASSEWRAVLVAMDRTRRSRMVPLAMVVFGLLLAAAMALLSMGAALVVLILACTSGIWAGFALSFRCPRCRARLTGSATHIFRETKRCPACKQRFG